MRHNYRIGDEREPVGRAKSISSLGWGHRTERTRIAGRKVVEVGPHGPTAESNIGGRTLHATRTVRPDQTERGVAEGRTPQEGDTQSGGAGYCAAWG